PLQQIFDFGIDAFLIKLSFQPSSISHHLVVRFVKFVAGFDPGLLARALSVNTLSLKMVPGLNPPNTVIRNGELALLLEVQPRKYHRRNSNRCQQDSRASFLEFFCHVFQIAAGAFARVLVFGAKTSVLIWNCKLSAIRTAKTYTLTPSGVVCFHHYRPRIYLRNMFFGSDNVKNCNL
ncbi:MAG: hypothetical protein JWO20_3030, partial [Candidatus Angelobacter sp.]|nr:hypothetical protein [Candidatus Angelobacter sp.]